jgi:hypothetical protein
MDGTTSTVPANYKAYEIRLVDLDGKPWWVLADVRRARSMDCCGARMRLPYPRCRRFGCEGNFVDTITDNRITRLAIEIGVADNGRIEVTAGLSEETPVVATIKSVLPPGTAVQTPMVGENP